MMSDSNDLVFAAVAEDTFGDAVALLEACGLPTSDLVPRATTMLGAFAGGGLVGTIALEPLGSIGLIRSMAVAPERRGRHLARGLYERLLLEAKRRNLTDLYCLTGSAEGFFTRLGFVPVERADAPAAIRATPQFSALCPASTRVYARRLTDTACYFPTDVLAMRTASGGARHFAVSLACTTLSYFEVEAGARFDRHSHAGEQITLVLHGELHFAFDDRQVCVRAGECVGIPPATPHAVRAGSTAVKAVDAWSPARLDL